MTSVPMIADEHGRSVPEWIGKTPDSMPPPRVRLRILRRFKMICQLSGLEIRPGDDWDLDHVIALTNGGENRESNLVPVLRDKHREKTKKDVAIKAHNDAAAKKHWGIAGKPKRKIQSRGFPKKPRKEKLPLPPRRGFA